MMDPALITPTELWDLLLNGLWQRADTTIGVVLGTLIALFGLNAIAPKFQLLDETCKGPRGAGLGMPLTGGLAILCGVWIGAMIDRQTMGAPSADVLALLGIVVAVHSFDDSAGLSARQRLLIDGVVALAFVVITTNAIRTLGVFGGVDLALGPLAVPVTVFIYVAISNAYNMQDGVDGLALSQFLLATAVIGIFHLVYAKNTGFTPHAFPIFIASVIVLLANLGVLGSFLRCFLGDSGARFLGFFLVYVGVEEGHTVLPVMGALYFVAVPLIDMTAVVAIRLRAGRGPMQRDRSHLHHGLIDQGVSPRRTLVLITTMSAFMLALFLVLHGLGASDMTLAATFLLVATAYWTWRRRLISALGALARGAPAIEAAE